MDIADRLMNEIDMFCFESTWGTYKNVNIFIQDHSVNWRSEVLNLTTLHVACQFGHTRLVKQLIEDGSNIHAKDICDETPLFRAIRFNRIEVVYYLIKNGSDVNAQSTNGWSVLHEACSKGNSFSARLLLDNGAKVNILDFLLNQTPLHAAADEMGSLFLVQTLVEDYYANIFIKECEGKTAEDLAREEAQKYGKSDEYVKSRNDIACYLKQESSVAPLKRRHAFYWLKLTWKTLPVKTYKDVDLNSSAIGKKRQMIFKPTIF